MSRKPPICLRPSALWLAGRRHRAVCGGISESSATAAIIALAFTIGSWVLDFALAGQPGVLEWISRLSLTQTLRTFEQGLLSAGLLLGIVAAIGGFAALAAVWLHPGVPLRTKFIRSLACVATVAAVLALATQVRTSVDLTEDRRNSFPAADQRALAELREPLLITVHLAPEDPRYVDLRRNVLAKLERALPDVTIRLATTRPKRRGQHERRGLRRDRIFLCGPRRQEPLDQPSRNPAAALCAGRKANSAAGRRRGLSGLPAGRRRTTDACPGSSAASRC